MELTAPQSSQGSGKCGGAASLPGWAATEGRVILCSGRGSTRGWGGQAGRSRHPPRGRGPCLHLTPPSEVSPAAPSRRPRSPGTQTGGLQPGGCSARLGSSLGSLNIIGQKNRGSVRSTGRSNKASLETRPRDFALLGTTWAFIPSEPQNFKSQDLR